MGPTLLADSGLLMGLTQEQLIMCNPWADQCFSGKTRVVSLSIAPGLPMCVGHVHPMGRLG